MALNKSKGQMYPWVTNTWNIIKGECPHQCSYCYCKRWGKQSELHFDNKELKTDLGSGNTIFVGSSCDAWAFEVSFDWILTTLKHCRQYPLNRYLFQSKIPSRFPLFLDFMPPDFILGTTIETNRKYEMTKAPASEARMFAMCSLPQPKMVSIEPIMDFDLVVMVKWIEAIEPEFVSIGADSQHHNLSEPSADKVKALIDGLKEFTEVKIKDNLKRITGVPPMRMDGTGV